MTHRLREAMRQGNLAPFGSEGGMVEADETFIGKDPEAPPPKKGKKARGIHHMNKILSLVDRDSQVRSVVNRA